MRHKVHPKPFGKPPHATPKTRSKAGINPAIFYVSVTALLVTNVATLVGFVMAPDIARLLSGQSEAVLAAYEDRVAELRVEVDRLHSRQYAQTGDINLQLQELSQQQEILSEQHQYVKLLADKASELGLDTGTLAAPLADDALTTGSIGPVASADPADQVAAAASAIDSMLTDSKMALAALSDEATDRTDEIVGALAGIGLKPKLPDIDDIDVGGPELPPVEGLDSSSMIDDANAVIAALERFKAAKAAAGLAPVHKPTLSATRISSTFGNRTDPFTKRKAFHSGIDFAAPWGSTVLAAGYGKVTFVGQMSGYGNVVEITHSNGLVTRYGHLSSFIVKEGAIVSTGTPIAKVGSTGRSTGPHLHFEVRRDDNAVDPARYLAVGRKLATMIG
ncbi:MAG TPA: M23 family metallopeptidase [Devosia sp.]|nr:M23 family metallopeptidase [Devosia sp.]